MGKIVKESLNEGLHGQLRINGVTYDSWTTPYGTVHAGSEGILGSNNLLIPWETIQKLIPKYTKS